MDMLVGSIYCCVGIKYYLIWDGLVKYINF